MNNHQFNSDQKKANLQSAPEKQNNSSAVSNERAAAAALLSYTNRGATNSMQSNNTNLGMYDANRQSLPSVLNPDALIRNMGINAPESGRLDAAAAADLIRQKMILEEQVRLELLSRLANLENNNMIGINPTSATHSFSNVEDKLKGSSEGKRRYSDVSTGREKRVKMDKDHGSNKGSSRLAEYPLPPLDDKKQSPCVGKLSSFRKTWKRLERMSDMMDDTPADQEAFVSELFSRTLNTPVSVHLRRKMAKLNAEREQE